MQKCKREEEKISFQNLDAEETLLTCSSCLESCSRGQSRSSPGFVGERAEVSQSSTSAPAENACPLPHTEENFLLFFLFLEEHLAKQRNNQELKTIILKY